MNIEAIVPVYNEEGHIKKVLTDIVKSKIFSKIFIINDGSTDHTDAEIRDFLSQVKEVKLIDYISYIENKGKGFAIAQAIEKLKGDYTLILDADILGYSRKNLLKLINPLKENNDIYTARIKSFSKADLLFGGIMGIRGYRTSNLIELSKGISNTGKYGVEVYMNYSSSLKPKYVVFEKSRHVYKPEKRGILGMMIEYIREVFSIVYTWLKIRVNL